MSRTPAVPTIFVEVDEAGEVVVRVAGLPGPACLELTADLERHLGDPRPGSRRRTAEWHEQPNPQPQPIVQRRP